MSGGVQQLNPGSIDRVHAGITSGGVKTRLNTSQTETDAHQQQQTMATFLEIERQGEGNFRHDVYKSESNISAYVKYEKV